MSVAPPPLAAFLTETKARVDAELGSFFEQKRAHAAGLSAPTLALLEAVQEFTMRGGKRTRPALLVAGYLAADPQPQLDRLWGACAGLELLQSYLLIHDDWMDQDEARRGGVTLHRLFTDRLHDAHLGASWAILAGDLANAFAIELFARAAAASQHCGAALEVFWTMQRDVVYGQALDLIAHDDVALIQRLKTGSYSVRGPLLAGAVLGGASPAQRSALERYAEPAGLAFQMRDDLLGTFGAPDKTGKPAGNDLRAGKRTALIEEAEAQLSSSELAPLHSVLGQSDASDAAVTAVIDLLERSSVRAAVEARVERLERDAQAALQDPSLREPGRQHLEQLVRMFAYRDH